MSTIINTVEHPFINTRINRDISQISRDTFGHLGWRHLVTERVLNIIIARGTWKKTCLTVFSALCPLTSAKWWLSSDPVYVYGANTERVET